MTRRGLEMVRIAPLKPSAELEPVARTVADVMRRDVPTVSPETSVHRAGRILVENSDHVSGPIDHRKRGDLVLLLDRRSNRPAELTGELIPSMSGRATGIS